jgi:acetate---CoA ligase (ADP-forming)
LAFKKTGSRLALRSTGMTMEEFVQRSSGDRERNGTRLQLLQALLAPRSVAIVGQSDDAGKTAGRPLKYLRQAGYAGPVYPVNPRRERVLGERAWSSLADLPEVPDHAYVVTGTEAAIAAVAECGRLGVKIATVLADGFAEYGTEGAAREARLREIINETGIRVVGPSSLGVVDLRTKAMLTANPTFDEPDLPAGRIFVASHSGSMIGSIYSRARARGVGFAALVSVGNEVDLSLGEICEAALDDPGIDGFMLFLETMRHAGWLRQFALAAAARGKPILAYKLGRSAAARELAVSHTGALAGEDDIADVFLAECGIARVVTLDGLIEGMPLLARMPPAPRTPGRRAVGVVTTTAGGATMVVDPLSLRGLSVEPPSAETLARIQTATGIAVKPARLIDLTVSGARYDAMKSALDILLTAPEFDFVLTVVGSSARADPEATVRPIIDSAGAGRPLAAFLVPEAPQALAMLAEAGVPGFRTPEACADAIAAALSRRAPRMIELENFNSTHEATAPVPPRSEAERWGGVGGGGRLALSQHPPPRLASLADPPHRHSASMTRVNALMAGRGLAASRPSMLDELEAGALLDRLGIARAPAIAIDATITQAPTLPFPYPVAVKILSSEIAHKTDAGGVVLNVRDGDALLAAIRQVRAAVAQLRPDTQVERVLVQQMVPGLGEVLIGYRIDPDVGPIVLVAAGGVLTEIERDRSLRLAPVDRAIAHEMLAEVRGLKMLTGYRGKPAGDLDALAQAIVALSQFAHDPAIAEAEINPLIVLPAGQGVIAVDALVRLA